VICDVTLAVMLDKRHYLGGPTYTGMQKQVLFIYKSLFTANTAALKGKKQNSASINTTATKSMTVDDTWYWTKYIIYNQCCSTNLIEYYNFLQN